MDTQGIYAGLILIVGFALSPLFPTPGCALEIEERGAKTWNMTPRQMRIFRAVIGVAIGIAFIAVSAAK
jgi:hypothetical protein